MSELLEMRNIVKKFPGVLALDKVNLSVKSGEVHALLGENGSGKSTLMKILSGAHKKDSGDILINGNHVEIQSAHDSQKLGISIIYQELNLTEQLTVAENIFMGRHIKKGKLYIDWKTMFDEAQKMLDQLDIAIDSHMLVRDLGVAHKQMVEIAKALSLESRILIMDEPTAPLTNREIDILFKTICRLKEHGVSVIYISHRLEEVFQVCDRATIIRDGKNIVVLGVADTSVDEVIRYMVGRDITEKFPKIHVPIGKEVINIKNLNAGKLVKDVSFSVHAGEIFCLTGLVGAGRTETVRALFGMDKKESGEIRINDQKVSIGNPLDAIKAGIGFATEDRKGEGLVLTMDVGQNITLASLSNFQTAFGVSLKEERKTINEYIKKLNIKTPSLFQCARNLSGGNQQKGRVGKMALKQSLRYYF